LFKWADYTEEEYSAAVTSTSPWTQGFFLDLFIRDLFLQFFFLSFLVCSFIWTIKEVSLEQSFGMEKGIALVHGKPNKSYICDLRADVVTRHKSHLNSLTVDTTDLTVEVKDMCRRPYRKLEQAFVLRDHRLSMLANNMNINAVPFILCNNELIGRTID
jgi:hypothetical protein